MKKYVRPGFPAHLTPYYTTSLQRCEKKKRANKAWNIPDVWNLAVGPIFFPPIVHKFFPLDCEQHTPRLVGVDSLLKQGMSEKDTPLKKAWMTLLQLACTLPLAITPSIDQLLHRLGNLICWCKAPAIAVSRGMDVLLTFRSQGNFYSADIL